MSDAGAAASTTTATPPGSASPGGPSAPGEVRSWAWHVMQVTSWLLAVMLPVHLWSIWIAHDAGDFGVATFVDRWHSTGWRLFDWAFLVLALAHGGVGLAGLIGSRVRGEPARTIVAVTLGVAFTVLAVLVSATVFSFDVT